MRDSLVTMKDGTLSPLETLMTGDLVSEGLVLSTHPYFLTSGGSVLLDGRRIALNKNHQIFVYFDNLHGHSCYQAAMVYNGNTMEGLLEHVFSKKPHLRNAVFEVWSSPKSHYRKTLCGRLFSSDQTEAHFVVRPANIIGTE